MRRYLQVLVLLISSPIVGCVSAKDRLAEQQEVARSMRSTTNPEDVKGCDFIMTLRPDGIHKTPEAQAASLVLVRPGVGWVILDRSGASDLYTCKLTPTEPSGETPTPAPVERTPAAAPPTPIGPTLTPTRTAPATNPAGLTPTPEPSGADASTTRITSNPEAIKGCKFLASLVQYRNVPEFQRGVLMSGGNIGYVVASNQNGDVIGESYWCDDSKR